MEFRTRKLPKAKAAELSSFPIDQAEPYRPLPAPVYLLLPRNEKMVSVKGPFDFFTARDLARLKDALERQPDGGAFYFGPIYSRVEPFQSLARDVQKMLGWNAPNATSVLEPAPYELSDAVLRKLGTAWAPLSNLNGADRDGPIAIESYFAVAFANELCEPIPGDWLEFAREKDPDFYELSLLRSGVFVFLALHLGYLDLKMLSAYRKRFFSDEIKIFGSGGAESAPFSLELAELKRWTENLIHSPEVLTISSDQFEHSISRITQKLKSRLQRVRRELTDPASTLAHTYDDGGLGNHRPEEEEAERVG
ncbi:MAG: hypothetical protein JST04_12640 [Bdellovibrionales bacterium]|nr:hypothetical protein [Bdellovibrionales bacterium]